MEYGLLVLGVFLVITATIRIVKKIPFGGIGIALWGTLGNIIGLVIGIIFIILGIMKIIP